jgi:hypothetical protein
VTDIKIDGSSNINENGFNEVLIYSFSNSVYIKNVGMLRATSLPMVEIMDMTGCIIHKSTITNPETVISLAAANGIYMVRLISQDGKMTAKKVLITN